MRLIRNVLAALGALLWLLAGGDVARAIPAACKAGIVKANAVFVLARAKALQKCEDAKLRGRLPADTVCTAAAETAPVLAKAKAKLGASIAKACGGKDRVCGGIDAADDVALADIGWNVGSCPDFETGDCTNAIASCNDIPICLDCIDEAAVDQAMTLYYGSLAPTDPTSHDPAVRALGKCQATIGRFATALLTAKTNALAGCWKKVTKSGAGTCPDTRATKAIAKAQAKTAAAITRACRGADRVVGTSDDLTPAAIGFPSSCLDVTPVGGAICSGTVDSLPSLLACVDCVTRFKADCPDRAAVPAYASPYPTECNSGIVRRECSAQRVVQIVAGAGSLAWYTQVWPLPEVIAANDPAYAYDDVTKAALVPGTDAGHPLYARLIDGHTLWSGTGSHVDPSVFVAGTNQAHTTAPTTMLVDGGPSVIAAGAALQGPLGAPLPALAINVNTSMYGTAPGAPALVTVTNADTAIGALQVATTITPEMLAILQPSPATLAAWGVDGTSPVTVVALARNLLFAANAFRLGLVSTVLLPGFNDDPHGAFVDPPVTATPRVDALTRILDGFYAELAAHREPGCSHDGRQISLADNTLLVVSGDTYKNPFTRAGWPDGTPTNSNILYVRANGYLRPGWFGAITFATGRTNFDPDDGTASGTTTTLDSTTAAQLGILFAIARGNTAAVTAASTAPYGGVIATTLP